ncbi:hypothetical protein AB1Y20_000149 [Prymnesium parvum]|uniref:Trichome birefringence-like C-terminal domain-containing protein n=1 Tax=Prymnesium parvum TaxID=97485 RepID=A0AB34K516_PRYPA
MPASAPCYATSPPLGPGEWLARPLSLPRPYRINASLWAYAGTSITGKTPQHYGRCDDVSDARPLYEWAPRSCALARFNADEACTLLRGKALLFVGDSTVAQLFLSFVLLLHGRLGLNNKRASVLSDISASACADAVRLNFVRSDLLLWTHAQQDFQGARGCDGYTTLQPFATRAARDADVLILGVGHHFSSSLERVAGKYEAASASEKKEEAAAKAGGKHGRKAAASGGRMSFGANELARQAFFSFNLNHTLSSALTARRRWGHASAASVFLVGISTPIPGCRAYDEPISLSRAVLSTSAHPRGLLNRAWKEYASVNEQANWLAEALGVTFIDVALPSAMRPDGAMARFWPPSSYKSACNEHGNCALKDDCVHYCLPGPVDAWSTMIYNKLRALSDTPLAKRQTASDGGHQRGTIPSGPGRYFAQSLERWLGARGAALQLENSLSNRKDGMGGLHICCMTGMMVSRAAPVGAAVSILQASSVLTLVISNK